MVMSFIESGFTTKVEYEAWLAASIEVHYWPMFGRAGSLIRMLEHTGTPYKHVGPPFDALGSAWEGTADVFAVPIVKDGDYIISQSVAAALYVGKRTGLTPVGYDVFKATQYCMDLVDTFEGNLGKNNEHGPTLKKFLTGDRWAKLLGNVERSIKGPFYFGDAPSAPDFFLLSLIDFNDAKMFDKLKPLTGDVFSLYPKISGVVAALREATPYKEYKGLTIILPNFTIKQEIVDSYNA